jgi:hypothetical protein
LGIETDHEAQIFGQGLTFFIRKLVSDQVDHSRRAEATGLYWRARRNAERIVVRHNDIRFEICRCYSMASFCTSAICTWLNEALMRTPYRTVGEMRATWCSRDRGDFRTRTPAPRVRSHLRDPSGGGLATTIHSNVPGLEAMDTNADQRVEVIAHAISGSIWPNDDALLSNGHIKKLRCRYLPVSFPYCRTH